jgi:triacylglycerol lipase
MLWRLGSICAVLAIAALLAYGWTRSPSAPGDSFPGTASYSVPTAKLDRALACKGGTANLDGEGKLDPVLLVHGRSSTPEHAWGSNYWTALPDRGFDACWVQLPDGAVGDIQIDAEYIARAIEVMHEATGEQIDVLGMSQGGVSSRWAVKYFPAGAFVDDQIALVSPNHGADLAEETIARDGSVSEGLWQLDPDSNFLRSLNRGDESPGPVDYTSVYSKTDPLLKPPRTQGVEGGTNILLQDLCPGRRVSHGDTRRDAVVYELVIDALTNPGGADPARVDPNCSQVWLPGADTEPVPVILEGPVDPHITDREPPLMPYAQGG